MNWTHCQRQRLVSRQLFNLSVMYCHSGKRHGKNASWPENVILSRKKRTSYRYFQNVQLFFFLFWYPLVHKFLPCVQSFPNLQKVDFHKKFLHILNHFSGYATIPHHLSARSVLIETMKWRTRLQHFVHFLAQGEIFWCFLLELINRLFGFCF